MRPLLLLTTLGVVLKDATVPALTVKIQQHEKFPAITTWRLTGGKTIRDEMFLNSISTHLHPS
jgi:hypothetical protein